MSSLSNSIADMFTSDIGSELYTRICETVEKEKMLPYMEAGVLVGLSGGADSVFLACFLSEYRRRSGRDFGILAVHVNHGIRGAEADRDEAFSRAFAKELRIPFESVHVDVPAISQARGIGIEEAARNARYSVFNKIISNRI